MKFEKQTIYKKYNSDGNISYLLILDVQKRGMSFVYLTNTRDNMFYSNIDGLYIADIDQCIAINRILYADWYKVPVKYYEEYRKLSIREMRKITTAIKDLYDGTIVYDTDGYMCYSDEIVESSKTTTKKKESAEIDQQPSESQIHKESLEENNVGCLPQKIEIESHDNMPIDVSEEKYVDLLKDIPKSDEEFIRRRSTKSKNKNRTGRMHKRYFSELEALAICYMQNLAIIEKYNVSSSIASKMKKNALEYFGISADSKNVTKKNRYTQFFDRGYTCEQVETLYPESAARIRNNYKMWKAIKQRQTLSDCMSKFDSIVNSDNLDELIKINDMKSYQIIEYFECTSNDAASISCKTRRALSKKSILFTVFGTQVFDTDKFNKFIDDSRKKYLKDNIVTVTNYDTCMRLKDIYDETYDIHQDIIIGAKPIPECIASEDIPRFISIVKRSFTRRMKDDHIPNIQSICSNRDYVGYATVSMISYTSALSAVSCFNKKNK